MVCTWDRCSIYQDCVKRLDEDVTRDTCFHYNNCLVGPFELRVPPRTFMGSTPCSKLHTFNMEKVLFVLRNDEVSTADIEELRKDNRATLLSKGPQADLFVVDDPWKPHVDMMIKTKHLMEAAAASLGKISHIGIHATVDDKPFDCEEFDRVTRDLKNRFANRELMSKASNETLVELIIAIIVEYKERADHSEQKAQWMEYLKIKVNNAIGIEE